jgi:hypothetical protein
MLQDSLGKFDQSMNNAVNGVLNGNQAANQLPNQNVNQGIEGLGNINNRESGTVELPYSFLYKSDSDSYKIPMDTSNVQSVQAFKANIINFINKLGMFSIVDNNPQSVDFFVQYANTSTIPDSIDQNGNRIYNSYSYHVYCALNQNDIENAIMGIVTQPNEVTVLFAMCMVEFDQRMKLNKRNIQLLDYEVLGDINENIDKKRQGKSILVAGSSFKSLLLGAIRDSANIQCTNLAASNRQNQLNQAFNGITSSIGQIANNITSNFNGNNGMNSQNQYDNSQNPYANAYNNQASQNMIEQQPVEQNVQQIENPNSNI